MTLEAKLADLKAKFYEVETRAVLADLQGKDITSEQISNYTADNMGDNKTGKGLNNIIEPLKDKKLGEISPKELAKIATN